MVTLDEERLAQEPKRSKNIGGSERIPAEAADLLELGQKIQRQRERLGKSQEELALEIGTDKGKISRYESGQMVMKVERFFRIAETLRIFPETLCPERLRCRPASESALRRLAELLEKLPAEKQTVARQAAEAMAIGFQSVD